jgi:hypothetical protein
MRVKITGYIETDQKELDPDTPTGLDPTTYRQLTKPSAKGAVKVADLEDLSLEATP